MRAVLLPERRERSKSQLAKAEEASRGLHPPERPMQAALPAPAVAIFLLAIFSLAGLSWWKEHGRPAAPVAAPRSAPLTASLADDEPHSFARTRSDYAWWVNQMRRWLAKGDPEIQKAKRLDPEVERKELPPIEAARACLQRHLQRLVTIDSLEPIGYQRVGEAVAIDYRAVVRCRIDLYVVSAWHIIASEEDPEVIQRVWPNLLLDAQLPPGCAHDVQNKVLLLKANEPFVFRWRVERAQVVDGQWKILLATPSLLEWNCAFVAAELMALREGKSHVFRIAGNRCLEPFPMAFWATMDQLVFDYYATWGFPGAEPPGLAARAQGWLRATQPQVFASPGPILQFETAPRLVTHTLTLQGYGAEIDWAKPILAPIRQLRPQDAESRFLQRYRDLAEGRNRWIDAFVLQRAQIENQRGKARLPR
ncbi:MAG: hypothetical protein PHO89_09915 [Methylacidiphilaceae bacterium]|nr:hypothetical protein [Candidatus Methylacidiphilaceae bacterium]